MGFRLKKTFSSRHNNFEAVYEWEKFLKNFRRVLRLVSEKIKEKKKRMKINWNWM